MPERARGDRARPSAARCSTRARASTWRRWPAASDIADLLDLDRPLGETRRARRRAQGHRRARRDGRRARPPAPRGRASTAIREAGARVRLITRRRRVARAAGRRRRTAGRPAVGHRRHARGRHLRGGAQVHRRRAGRPAVAARRRRAPGRHRRRLRPRRACSPATTSCSGDDCFFSATGVTDGDVLQGVRYEGARGATTESLVMRSRSGTVRRVSVAPRPRQAARRSRGEPLRLISAALAAARWRSHGHGRRVRVAARRRCRRSARPRLLEVERASERRNAVRDEHVDAATA